MTGVLSLEETDVGIAQPLRGNSPEFFSENMGMREADDPCFLVVALAFAIAGKELDQFLGAIWSGGIVTRVELLPKDR